MATHFKNKFQEYLFHIINLLAFIAFYIETDIYTPSFPDMVAYFGTNEDSIQMLLSMNFLGLCLSSLWFGPASDAYGRKTMLCTGLGIFMLGSLGCSATDSLSWMIFFRLLQGIGCGAIVSAGLASLFDIYPPEKSSRLISVLNGSLGGMMALAPLLGNWISLTLGWRWNFYLIALLATLAFLSTLILRKETLPQDKRTKLNLSGIARNYFSILCNLPFMALTLIWCLMFSVVIVFIANLSLIFVDHLRVPPITFGYYQTAIMGAFFGGSMSAAYFMKKFGLARTKIAGSLIFMAGVAGLALLSYLGNRSPILLITTMSLASLGSALAVTIYFTYSMTHIGEQLKGSAMSLTQSLRLLISSGLVWLAASQFDGTTLPMSLCALFSTALCLAFYGFLYRRNLHVALESA